MPSVDKTKRANKKNDLANGELIFEMKKRSLAQNKAQLPSMRDVMKSVRPEQAPKKTALAAVHDLKKPAQFQTERK